MNHFCFGWEGSTDSLYEAPQTSPGRTSWSPVLEPSQNPAIKRQTNNFDPHELLQTPGRLCKMDLKQVKRKSRASELTRMDDKSHVYCPCIGKRDDLVRDRVKDASEDPCMMTRKERIGKNERNYDVQIVEDKTHLQKMPKLLKNRYPPDISEDPTIITCMGLTKKPVKTLRKESIQQPEPGNERNIREMDILWNLGHFHQHHWSTMDTCSFWESTHHSCQRPTVEPWLHNVNFTLPRGTDRHRYEEVMHDLDRYRMEHPSPRILRSFTDLNMTDTMANSAALKIMLQRRTSNASEKPRNKPKRSYSFGRYDTSKNQASLEEREIPLGQGADGDSSESDRIKGGLGKKMKAISLTMRKKMGKKYTRALSEETGDGAGDQEAEERTTETEAPAKVYSKSSNSVESLFSLHSGQSSSSSGITCGSEGSCKRDSLRLEEGVLEIIHFCGKAKVHTDFIPSPYDTESLKLKAGDLIDVISKSPMGIWTGMLNGKVGSFKFIYVDILAEEPAPVHRMRNHRRSRRPRPKTLQEFLQRLNLEEFMSSLLLNGYQTVDDLKDLNEQHLIELNVTDPDQRHKLLAATEGLHDAEANSQREPEGEEASKSLSVMENAEVNDCPRDSGCYVASDCSENSSKEDAESHLTAPLSQSPSEA